MSDFNGGLVDTYPLRLDRLERDINGNGNPGLIERVACLEDSAVTKEELKEELAELSKEILDEVRKNRSLWVELVRGLSGVVAAALGAGGVLVVYLSTIAQKGP